MPKLANKNYPYPIITNDASFSSYDGISYSFSFEKETSEKQLINPIWGQRGTLFLFFQPWRRWIILSHGKHRKHRKLSSTSPHP